MLRIFAYHQPYTLLFFVGLGGKRFTLSDRTPVGPITLGVARAESLKETTGGEFRVCRASVRLL